MTSVLWLIVGLGMFVPDHTYESRASLHVAMYEVHTGRQVYRTRESGGPGELALVSRSSGWSLVTQIIIPPFLIGSDHQDVVEEVRAICASRLMYALSQRLKSVVCQQELSESAPATISAQRVGGRLTVSVRSTSGLSFLRIRVDGRALEGPEFQQFESDLLASETSADGFLSYEATYQAPLQVGLVQVLLLTVGGGAFSSTIDLDGQ